MKNKENQEKSILFELNKRLGVVVSLLLRMLPKEGAATSLREQIGLLSSMGMRPKEIAEILGRTQSFVNKELVTIKKQHAKKQGKNFKK